MSYNVSRMLINLKYLESTYHGNAHTERNIAMSVIIVHIYIYMCVCVCVL